MFTCWEVLLIPNALRCSALSHRFDDRGWGNFLIRKPLIQKVMVSDILNYIHQIQSIVKNVIRVKSLNFYVNKTNLIC
jgi:hypothetical protein